MVVRVRIFVLLQNIKRDIQSSHQTMSTQSLLNACLVKIVIRAIKWLRKSNLFLEILLGLIASIGFQKHLSHLPVLKVYGNFNCLAMIRQGSVQHLVFWVILHKHPARSEASIWGGLSSKSEIVQVWNSRRGLGAKSQRFLWRLKIERISVLSRILTFEQYLDEFIDPVPSLGDLRSSTAINFDFVTNFEAIILNFQKLK